MDFSQKLAKYQSQAKKEKQSTNNPHFAASNDKLSFKVFFSFFVESLDDS